MFHTNFFSTDYHRMFRRESHGFCTVYGSHDRRTTLSLGIANILWYEDKILTLNEYFIFIQSKAIICSRENIILLLIWTFLNKKKKIKVTRVYLRRETGRERIQEKWSFLKHRTHKLEAQDCVWKKSFWYTQQNVKLGKYLTEKNQLWEMNPCSFEVITNISIQWNYISMQRD